jgi:ribosome maturation factor RimP
VVGILNVDQLERIRAVAERVAQSLGLEVFDVQWRREAVGPVLRIIIDRVPQPQTGAAAVGAAGREESVTVDDCRRVSDDASALLDVEDVIDHAYTLEVSSPGLDRPLRHMADFRRFQGRLAKIVVSEAVDGQKHLTGRLEGVEGDLILLADAKDRVHRIRLPLITRARLEVEF